MAENKKEEEKTEAIEEIKSKPESKIEPKIGENEKVEVPAKFKDLVEKIESMSVLELHELVKLLEKKFGVSAQAMAVAGPNGGGEAEEEKSLFTVKLISDGGAKIPVMKVVKELMGLGLKEAKDLVEGAPVDIKVDIKKSEAEEIKKKIEEAGGKVELK